MIKVYFKKGNIKSECFSHVSLIMLGKLTIDVKTKMNILPQNLLKLTLSFLHISADFYFLLLKSNLNSTSCPLGIKRRVTEGLPTDCLRMTVSSVSTPRLLETKVWV